MKFNMLANTILSCPFVFSKVPKIKSILIFQPLFTYLIIWSFASAGDRRHICDGKVLYR